MRFVLIALFVIVVFIAVRCIRIVQQAKAYVIEFLLYLNIFQKLKKHFLGMGL